MDWVGTVIKPILTLKKAPVGKRYALAVAVHRGVWPGFHLLKDAGTFTTKAAAEAKRATFPAKAEVLIVLVDEPQA